MVQTPAFRRTGRPGIARFSARPVSILIAALGGTEMGGWRGERSGSAWRSLKHLAVCFRGPMGDTYVHGYDHRENRRLQDQAGTLVELLHRDTQYPAGNRVLEAGCGVGAQTLTLALRSPE